METLNMILAYLGRAWTVVWTKAKAILLATWDPKPRTILVWLCCWLAICVTAIGAWSMGTSWVNNKLASMVGLSSDVQPLLSGPVDATKPDPIPGLRIELPKPLPVPPVKVEAKADEPAKTKAKVEGKTASKPKRSKKKQAAATSDPWQF